jgi:hypothetical protein
MKITITESQFYNLIPLEVRRRLDGDDVYIIDKTIKRLYRAKGNWFHSENFEDYLHMVISDAVSYFVRDHKHLGIDEDNWEDINDLELIYGGLIPYLKKKYHNEMKRYYEQMKN